MYRDDATSASRDRISDSTLRRLLNGNNAEAERCPPSETDFCSTAPSVRQTCAEPTPKTTWGLTNYPLASVFAPLQPFRNLYDCQTAWNRGTVFSELDLPFMGETVSKGGSCHA